MTDKKENARPKAETRQPNEIFVEKANTLGDILNKQIVKLKKLQINAKKSGNFELYNIMLVHFADKILALEMDDKTEIVIESGFNLKDL